MRIALIADIHGNAVALRRVLEEIDGLGIETIICLGDVAATGPQPREAVEEVRRRGIATVLGNADAEILDPPDPEQADEPMKSILEMSIWGSQQLAGEDRAFLSGLPAQIQIDTDCGSLLCVHGSPRSYDDSTRADTPEEDLDEMLAGRGDTIIASGHTHIQMLRRYGRQMLVNPGSVGLSYDPAPPAEGVQVVPWAEFAVIECEDGRLTCHFHRTPYDIEPLLAIALDSGMPHAGAWAGMWRQPG